MTRPFKIFLLITVPLLSIMFIVAIVSLYHDGKRRGSYGRKALARDQIKHLELACYYYYDQYDEHPLSEGKIEDATVSTHQEKDGLINTLHNPEAAETSPYQLHHLNYQQAKNRKSGVLISAKGEGFVDPWGQPFLIRFDYDYNKSITDETTGIMQTNTNFLIWSIGPDGKNGTADDITNWIR